MRTAALALALTFSLAGVAAADEAIPTAASGPAPRSGPVADVDDPDAPPLRDVSDEPAMGPCGPTRRTADGKPDLSPHGQVEVGVGTGGYRHIGGVVCKPLSANSAVTIAVSQTQWNGAHRGRR
jgi:hypothetical protein